MTYDQKRMLADFANRTCKNLEIIQEIQKTQPECEAFEVTQLINSMLGLLVFPKEQYLDAMPDKSLEELKTEGWPIPTVQSGYNQAESLKQLLRFMRNGITHFNVEFLPNSTNEIPGIVI